MRQRQPALLDVVSDDDRPLGEWVASMLTLVPRIYAADSLLAAEFEAAIRHFASVDLACIRTDHPEAPPPGAPARAALAFLLDHYGLRTQLSRLLARVDQVAGRAQVLAAAHGSTHRIV